MKRSLEPSTNMNDSKFARLTKADHSTCRADQASTSDEKNFSRKVQILSDGVYFVAIKGLKDDPQPERTLSLFELINKVNPIASIHFNYCIDPGFVLMQYPRRCRSFPITLVVGENSQRMVAQACSDFPNVTVGGASIPFFYCTHHSKLSIFESEDAIHVVISTANLIPEDYGLKTQAFYYCRAAFFTGDEPFQPSKFQEDLLEYLERAYPKNSSSHCLVSYWTSRIKQGDFSHVKDRLIASVPGRYASNLICHFGHMKLRKVLSEKFTLEELKQQKLHIAQFSSIGSLGSLPQTWLCDEFLSSLAGRNCLVDGGPACNLKPFCLNGFSFSQYLEVSLSDCGERKRTVIVTIDTSNEVVRIRTKAIPHVKSYTSLNGNNQPQWMLLTSANLSHSAWGRLEKDRTQLFCRSYELGVLLSLKDHPELGSAGLTLPFDLPLLKYAEDDQPFLVDVPYKKPDCMGRTSVQQSLLAAMDVSIERGSGKVLSYDDIVMFGCDLQSLGMKHGWLTDNLINFAGNFLKNNIVKNEIKDKICIVYATLVEIIKYCDEREDNVELFKNIGLSPEKWALFLLNDSEEPDVRNGGVHWTLILFDPIKRIFLLFDSMEGSTIGKKIYSFSNKLSIYLNVDLDPMRSPPGIIAVQRCPKMSVSGDCGVYVIEYMQAVLRALNENICADSFTDIDLSHIDDDFIFSQRMKWYYLIMDLKKEQDEFISRK